MAGHRKCQARGKSKVLSCTGGNHRGGDLSAMRRNWVGQAGDCRLGVSFHEGSDAPDDGLLGNYCTHSQGRSENDIHRILYIGAPESTEII